MGTGNPYLMHGNTFEWDDDKAAENLSAAATPAETRPETAKPADNAKPADSKTTGGKAKK